MAFVYLQKRLDELGLNYRVGSAGVHGLSGYPASEEAERVVKKEGLDLSNHKAKPLSPALIHHAKYILTMEHWQKEWIQIWSENDTRIDVLSEFLPGGDPEKRGIPDPIGSSLEHYENVYRMIKVAINRWIDQVLLGEEKKDLS